MNTRLSLPFLSACVLSATIANADMSSACLEGLDGERITVLVATAAGGGYDTYARSFAPSLEKFANVSTRVLNVPAGGGRAARVMARNADENDLIILLDNTPYHVTTQDADADGGEARYLIDAFDTMGMVHIDEAVWLGRAGFDFDDFADAPLVGAAGAPEEALYGIVIAAQSLGINVEIVTGYEGTRDTAAAIARSEVDITWMSQASGIRRANDELLDVAMVLSNGPSAKLPDTPYLAGEGSVSWQLSEDLDPETRDGLRTLAEDVSSLLVSARGLHISRNVPEFTRGCVGDLVSLALMDEEFVETAESQGREVAAVSAKEAQAYVAQMSLAQRRLQDLASATMTELLEN